MIAFGSIAVGLLRFVTAPGPDAADRSIDPSAPTAVSSPETNSVESNVVRPAAVETPTSVHEDRDSTEDGSNDAQPPRRARGPWSGFTLRSDDGAHSLGIRFFGQVRGTVRDEGSEDPSGGFLVRLARPALVAELWRGRVSMLAVPELAGARAILLDATVNVRVHDAVVIQVGQYRPWLTRGFRTGLPVQGLTGRGPIFERFRVDRDVGVTLRGAPLGGKFEYYVGVLNGSGINETSFAPSPLLTARFVVAPLGPVPYSQTPYVREVGLRSVDRRATPSNALAIAVGAAAYTVANRESVEDGDGETLRTDPRRRWGASGDVVVSRRRVFTMAEGYYEYREGLGDIVDTQHDWGIYGQAGVLVWNPFVDVSFRAGAMSDVDSTRVPIEPGVGAYIFGNHAKVQASYRCDMETGERGCAVQLGILQAQLQF